MAQGNSDPEGPLGDGITRSVATVALDADDQLAWSILTNSPDTPLYQEVQSLLYPLCGGWYHLAGAESTSLATRDEVSMSYTVASGRVTLDNAVGFGFAADSDRSPEDWLVDCDERTALAEAILQLLELTEYESPPHPVAREIVLMGPRIVPRMDPWIHPRLTDPRLRGMVGAAEGENRVCIVAGRDHACRGAHPSILAHSVLNGCARTAAAVT
jgi:hypothetical protein